MKFADDVAHKRHKKNPFDQKYLSLALAPFDIVDNKGKRKNVVTKADVEEASTNVHVRAELIRTMRDVLSKKTTEAVRELKTTAREPGSKPTKSSQPETFIETATQRRNNQGVLELNLDDAVANAISKISGNKSLFLKRDELCYNLTSSTAGNLESTISRCTGKPCPMLLLMEKTRILMIFVTMMTLTWWISLLRNMKRRRLLAQQKMLTRQRRPWLQGPHKRFLSKLMHSICPRSLNLLQQGPSILLLDRLVVSKFREADSSSTTRQNRQIRDAERLLMPPQQCEEPIPSDPWDDTDMDRDMFRLSLYRSRFDIVSYREKLFTDPSTCSMGSSAVETSSCGNARGKRPRLQDLIEQVMSRDAYPEHLSDPSSISALSHKLEKDIAVAVKSGERAFRRDHLTNMLGQTSAKGTMTAQRYLMVLLSLAHHHNMLPPERREPTISDTDFVLRCASGAGPSCVELSLSAITSKDE
ncbi:unnamed protein product [Closterium sp. Yama58-4]|nr:unnamed protein product [Closterium sp. Yama58-4]